LAGAQNGDTIIPAITEDTMRAHAKLNPRLAVGLATLAILGPGAVAMAQDSDLSGFRAACAQDYRRYCTGDDPGVAVETACLSQYYINLSLSCRDELDKQNTPSTGTSAPTAVAGGGQFNFPGQISP
jgi:hypothetical protein